MSAMYKIYHCNELVDLDNSRKLELCHAMHKILVFLREAAIKVNFIGRTTKMGVKGWTTEKKKLFLKPGKKTSEKKDAH